MGASLLAVLAEVGIFQRRNSLPEPPGRVFARSKLPSNHPFPSCRDVCLRQDLFERSSNSFPRGSPAIVAALTHEYAISGSRPVPRPDAYI